MSLALQIVRASSVCFVVKYLSDFNCLEESCITTNLVSIDLVVEAFPLVLSASATDFLVQESQSKVLGVVTNKSAGAKSGSDCSATTGLPVLDRQLLYSSHQV